MRSTASRRSSPVAGWTIPKMNSGTSDVSSISSDQPHRSAEAVTAATSLSASATVTSRGTSEAISDTAPDVHELELITVSHTLGHERPIAIQDLTRRVHERRRAGLVAERRGRESGGLADAHRLGPGE